MVFEVSSGQLVLVLWDSGCSPDLLKAYVETLQKGVEPGGRVQVENVERLSLCEYITVSWCKTVVTPSR